MRLFGFEINRVSSEERATLKDAPRWLQEALGGMPTASGASVNEETAMKISAVFGCVRILSETIGSLSLKVYQRQEKGRRVAFDHYLYPVLHDQGNDLMTAMELRELMVLYLCLWGNCYCEIEYNGTGEVVALWPIHPRRVEVKIDRSGGVPMKAFKVTMPHGSPKMLPAWKVLHIPALSYDGIVGKSPIRMARESIGVAASAEKFGAKFFANDGTPGIVLIHPSTLKPEALQRLKDSWAAAHQGADNAFKTAVIEEDMKVEKVGLPPEDLQFLETRKFQIAEIARFYRVPLHMLNELDRATFSNIEHQSLEFVIHTLRPWLVRIEQRKNMQLLMSNERREYYVEHVVDSLLRGDVKSRYEAYAVGRQWGWFSANDVRERENENPIDGGDQYLVPMNMVPANSPTLNERFAQRRLEARAGVSRGELRLPERRASLPPRYRFAKAMLPVLEDLFRRLNKREIVEITKGVERHLVDGDLDGFRNFLEEFEPEHASWMLPRVLPVYQMFAEQMVEAAKDEIGDDVEPEDLAEFVRDYADAYVNRHSGSTRGQLEALLEEEEPEDAVRERLEGWEESRAEVEADRERVRASNAFTQAAWTVLGVVAMSWRNVGSENCPMCEQMHGRKVSITEYFAKDGDTVGNPEGTSLRVYGNLHHPPLHGGCDCIIMPESA